MVSSSIESVNGSDEAPCLPGWIPQSICRSVSLLLQSCSQIALLAGSMIAAHSEP